MLDIILRPLRSVLGSAEHEVMTHSPLEETEREILDAVTAVHNVTESIEHHVEVIEGLATSVGPLTESVNQLTATMQQLVELLGPMAAAEREVHKAEHFFGLRRHKHDEPGQATSD